MRGGGGYNYKKEKLFDRRSSVEVRLEGPDTRAFSAFFFWGGGNFQVCKQMKSGI